jgi:hypothetical protein
MVHYTFQESSRNRSLHIFKRVGDLVRYTFVHFFLRFPTHEVLAASPACFKSLVGLRDKPYLIRVYTLLRHRVFKNGLVRNLGTLAIV